MPVAFASTLLCHEDPDVAIRGPEADGNDPRCRETLRVRQGAAQSTIYVHQNTNTIVSYANGTYIWYACTYLVYKQTQTSLYALFDVLQTQAADNAKQQAHIQSAKSTQQR